MSSVTKSMLLPRGFVLWHNIWIAFFMNSTSASVKPVPPETEELPLFAVGSTPPTFLANYSLLAPPAAGFFYGPSLRTILTPPPAAGASFLLVSSSSSPYAINFLASSTNALFFWFASKLIFSLYGWAYWGTLSSSSRILFLSGSLSLIILVGFYPYFEFFYLAFWSSACLWRAASASYLLRSSSSSYRFLVTSSFFFLSSVFFFLSSFCLRFIFSSSAACCLAISSAYRRASSSSSSSSSSPPPPRIFRI